MSEIKMSQSIADLLNSLGHNGGLVKDSRGNYWNICKISDEEAKKIIDEVKANQ